MSAPEPSTIRELAEAILVPVDMTDETANAVVQRVTLLIREYREHALAILDALDNADRPGLQDMYLGGACSCDAPDGRSDCCTCDQGYCLVSDPRREPSTGDTT